MQKTINIAEKISPSISRAGWEITYDEDTDSLYWTILPFPKNDTLMGFSPEVSFYVDSFGDVNGIMIEYFKSDFIALNRSVAGLTKFLTKEKDGYLKIPEGEKAAAQSALVALLESVKKNARESIAQL